MAKLKLITDVSKIGLLQGLARTRKRLIGSTVTAVLLTYGVGLFSAHYILETSASVVANMLIITGTMFLVLITSFLIAVLIGDLTFSGPWRETVFLGGSRDDLDRAPVKNHSGEFLVIFVVAILVNAFGINTAAGGFLEQYHTVGYFEVRLRSEAPEQRVAAYETLTRDVNFQLWEHEEIEQLVLDGLDDPAPNVRGIAAWSAGKMKLLRARPRLIELVADDSSPRVVADAAVALGKLGLDAEARDTIQTRLTSTDDSTIQIGALRGLGLIGSPQSVDTVLKFIDADNDKLMVNAFWAIRKIGSEDARPATRSLIDDDTPLLKRCAAFDALKKVATEEDVLWAKRQYQTGEFDESCPARVWRERDGTKHRLVIDDSFREKLLKIIANQAAHEHKDWFQRIVNDPSEPERLRKVSSEVLRQLRRSNG
jgi:HEAT repeat protein